MSMDTQHQKSYNVLVIGDACTDIYQYGVCDRLSPEAPVPILKRSREERKRGMALNVAQNLRSFGVDVKVDCNKESIKKVRIIDERAGSHLLRIDIEPEIEPLDESRYTMEALVSFDAVIISDYNKGYVTCEKAALIIETMNILDIPIFVDSKKADLRCFQGCVIKINDKEFDRVKYFPDKTSVIVTMGKDGARLGDEVFPAVKTEMYDVCGAGDTFLASLAYKFLETQGNLEKAIKFANKCAAINVQHLGTYALTAEDVNGICV